MFQDPCIQKISCRVEEKWLSSVPEHKNVASAAGDSDSVSVRYIPEPQKTLGNSIAPYHAYLIGRYLLIFSSCARSIISDIEDNMVRLLGAHTPPALFSES